MMDSKKKSGVQALRCVILGMDFYTEARAFLATRRSPTSWALLKTRLTRLNPLVFGPRKTYE